MARILGKHARQGDIVGDESGDDPKRPSCRVDGPGAGELGDEEEEEGYVQEEEEGAEGDRGSEGGYEEDLRERSEGDRQSPSYTRIKFVAKEDAVGGGLTKVTMNQAAK